MTEGRRPVPIPDETSAAFWAAAAEHTLMLARCGVCGAFSHPPGPVCPHCGSTAPEFAFERVEGIGTVRSWTVVRQSFLPGFEVPFVLVDVELDIQSDLRLIGRLVQGADAPLQIGMRVGLTFEDLAPRVAVPAFTTEVGA